MAAPTTPIFSLPNELLSAILIRMPTRKLLPLTLVCRRFNAVAVQILHQRLLGAPLHPKYNLILECYHPSEKIQTPTLACHYLGTAPLAQRPGRDDHIDLAGLSQLYTRFRPALSPDTNGQRRQPRAQQQSVAAMPETDAEADDATVALSLDEGELFTQLVTSTSVVKVGPTRGLFLGLVNIDDTVLRVWRSWLAAAAAGELGMSSDETAGILWTDSTQNVGIRFEVRPQGGDRMPLLVGPDEDVPVFYTLTYRELLVRTRRLLLGVEKCATQAISHSGKAVVIASI